MLLLFLIWLLLGALTGALALAARLRPASWTHLGWLGMFAIGIVAALLGGWLGMLILGKFAATATALWVAVVGVVLLPKLIVWARRYMTTRGAGI
ncbi:MAG: GlsB/YeaQ/YmgE family stress response membrane protein [Chloroflexota bacterium]|nr:GlsB/YeaQ/YmgE family stress response membrane protein [Chloroflexota bacterium]